MRMLIIALILFFAHSGFAAPSANECRRFFNYPDGTEQFISYLLNILNSDELMSFQTQLQKGEITNPIPNVRARVDSILQVHRGGFQRILDTHFIDIKRVLEVTNSSLAHHSKAQGQRTQAETQTRHAYYKMNLIPVPSGPFGPFEVMDTVVTQAMWVDVMGDNPSENQAGADTIQVVCNGKTISMRPDHPVEKMSFWAAVVFANAMSEKMNFEPVYNLDGIVFAHAQNKKELLAAAAKGPLTIDHDEGRAYEIYHAQNPLSLITKKSGFRLMSFPEYEYIGFGLSTKQDGTNYPMGLTKTEMADFAWGKNNIPELKTQPVGTTLKNLKVGKFPIFDFIGNVEIWASELWMPEPAAFKQRIIYHPSSMGSHYGQPTEDFEIEKPRCITLHNGSKTRGIRLVRSVVP